MALTKVTGQVIKNTTDVTVGVLTVTNTLAVGGTVSVGGTLTYEDVTNVDAVGIITARSNILVGSGITLSPDGNIFATGVTTSTSGIVDNTLTAGRIVFVDSDKSLTDNSALAYTVNGVLAIRGTGEGGPHVYRDGGSGPDITLNGSRGTIASPTASAGTDLLGNINFSGYDGSAYHRRASINGVIDGTVVDGSDTIPVAIQFQTGTTSKSERLRIDSSGRLLVGTTSNSNSVRAVFQGYHGGGDDYQARVQFQTNQATNLALNQHLANLLFTNSSGSVGAEIRAIADGAWGTNDYPGRLEFYTTPDGSNTSTERLRITSAGYVGINASNPTCQLQIDSGSGGDGTVTFLELNHGGNDTNDAVKLNFARAGGDIGSIVLEKVANNNTTDFIFNTRASNTVSESMRITGAGFVGISTITPNAKLHVLANNQAGILIEDDNANNSAPYLEIIGKRDDGNNHQSFAGQAFLARNRGGDKIEVDQKLGVVLFGGNHTNGSKSNIAYPASIAGIATGHFNSVTDMPTALAFYTGFTGRLPTVANVSSGVERMRISPEGYITKPYNVCFGATGNQGTYSVTTGQVFEFNSYHQSYPNSRNSGYNTSTYKFTAPVAGVYSFTVNLYFRDANLTNLFSLVPRINGSEVQGGAGDRMFIFSCQNINYDTTISGTVYLNLSAGDQVDVARRTGQTGTHSFYMPHSSFFGHLIG